MRDAILSFGDQLKFEPKLQGPSLSIKTFTRIIIAGMGGSHLAADVIHAWKPELPIMIHTDYALGRSSSFDAQKTILIASSYSGNTEETIDTFLSAGEKGIARAAITAGGKLADLAEEQGVPYILLPKQEIQPRSAIGLSLKALLKILEEKEALQEMNALSQTLIPVTIEEKGKMLAERIGERIPLIYASAKNVAIAYNWKIKCNETGKIPAFYNIFPESNHNEMTGFDAVERMRAIPSLFFFIFLHDTDDDPRNQKRMEVTANLYRNLGIEGEIIPLQESSFFEKVLGALILADWTAYYIAMRHRADPEHVPMVEEFKRLIANK